LLERWARRNPEEPFDIAFEMMQTTLEIIAQTMASTSLARHVPALEPSLRVLLRYAFHAFHNPLRLPTWVPTRTNREFGRAKAHIDDLVYALIEERRKEGCHRDDLLDVLLCANDTETGLSLSDEQIRDELITIFSAGHETTANALSWTWYLLATHPAACVKMRQEVDGVLADRRATVGDIPRLTYTRAVFEEALRLYPPAPAVQRRAVTATTLAGQPIPAGSIVVISIRNLHRHPECWHQPDQFEPDRFTTGTQPAAHRLAYMPFGAGPRTCVGNQFAVVEAVLLLAMIAQRYDLMLVPGQSVESELAITLRPRNGILMRAYPRSPSATHATDRRPMR